MPMESFEISQRGETSHRVALKVDVDTLRGTQEGVTSLLRLFDRYQVRATFLFSLGPDHTGRALRRVFRRGFLSKVNRTSVVRHYGIKTLMYGVLLPGPPIGQRSKAILRETQASGHETGIHCHDHVYWQDHVAQQDEHWTRQEMNAAKTIYETLFGKPATVHGAAGWQINPHVLTIEKEWGLHHASDTRGTHPFLPVMDSSYSSCPQLPTTLPTLDELLGIDGVEAHTVHEHVLAQSRRPLPHGHVYTLHAELEGMQLQPVMERLLQAWQAEGVTIGALSDLHAHLGKERLPRHQIVWGRVPGRSGKVAIQGEALPAIGADAH